MMPDSHLVVRPSAERHTTGSSDSLESLDDDDPRGGTSAFLCGPAWGAYGKLVSRVNRIRGYGDFVHYHLLARGALDAVIESDVNILDIAACVVIVREAGGSFTQLDGAPITLDSTSVLASNGALQETFHKAIAYH